MSDINSSFYQRSGRVKDINRTHVPDLYRQCAEELRAEEQKNTPQSSRTCILQSRPIVGVLFSISAGSDGELFPIYIGRNLIGRDEDCDVCLREGTVSTSHATLLARRQFDENGEEVIKIAISDSNSSCGTRVNGEDVDYEKVFCKNGDIITIGENYHLLLTLFESANRLKVSLSFERIPSTTPEDTSDAVISPDDSAATIAAPAALDHSESSTICVTQDEMEFYRPSRNKNQDHSNNKTIIV